ncbi:hypothetical protein [Microbacterium sp.]|uniref:hypothetical protein n=1 Tax=Microbacterium sp. TaxID=51671 RepID=UPI0039E6119A
MRTTSVLPAAVTLALAVSLVACTSAAVTRESEPTPSPTVTPTSEPTTSPTVPPSSEPVAPPVTTEEVAPSADADTCNGYAPYAGRVARDRGPMDMANGTIETDDSGAIVSYSVADGDTFLGIAQRLCFDGQTLAEQNGWEFDGSLRSGAVLIINP